MSDVPESDLGNLKPLPTPPPKDDLYGQATHDELADDGHHDDDSGHDDDGHDDDGGHDG